MTFRCLIVDDEPLARRVIANHLAGVPSLQLSGECANAAEASAFLHENPVDVIFLDIRMPGISGLDFLNTLTNRPQIILTTAYSKYALNGYEYAVVDYLLKPISFERFLQAVNKLRPNISLIEDKPKSILLRVDGGNQKIPLADIEVVEAFGNFIKIHTCHGRLLASETMKKIETLLPGSSFLRVHRSYIVALDKVDRMAGHSLSVSGHEIPVGRSYHRIVEDRLQSGPSFF